MKTIQQVRTAQYQRCEDRNSPPTMASDDPTATCTAARVVGRRNPVGSSFSAASSPASMAASSASSSSRDLVVAGVSSDSSCGPSRAILRPITARAASPMPRNTSWTAGVASGRFSSSR